ncbi:MAG: hypothetical protein IJZ30_04350 [Alphaproteobacteria bacterium]|nr:hypothetical protein [Alphaproteobacteria bacterium]
MLEIKKNKNMILGDMTIMFLMAFLCIVLFIFNFWLFYPGYIGADWIVLMAYWGMDNHYPIMYTVLLKLFSDIFGRHLYMPLFFNLIPFYLSIYILCLGCWKRFHSKWCFSIFILICVGNVFFNNIVLHSCFSSSMFVFLLWSIVLYQILAGITYKNMIALGCAFIFAVLSRHNAIIQSYPIFFIYSYIVVGKMDKSYVWLKYSGLMMLFAVFTIGVLLGISSLLKKGTAYPSNFIFLHQMAGVCIANNDKTCFKDEWYEDGRNYEYLVKIYSMDLMNADNMVAPWVSYRPFKTGTLDGLKMAWLKSIIKYPKDYLRCIGRFVKAMWMTNAVTEITPNHQHYSIYMNDVKWLRTIFLDEELFYEAPESKIKIYNFLRLIFPVFKTIHFVVFNFVLFAVVLVMFFRRKDVMLLYVLSSLISGIAGSIIFCIFSPVPAWNYVYPVFISTIMAVVGLLLHFIIKSMKKREI